MWLSTAIVLVGIAMLFACEGETRVDLGHFAAPGALNSLNSLYSLNSWENLKPTSIILVGLILLILTPVMRVALTMILFARERDFVYVAVSGAVLAIVITALLAA